MLTFEEVLKAWEEDKHPRDEDGKFTEGSGTVSTVGTTVIQAGSQKLKSPSVSTTGLKPANFSGENSGNRWRTAVAAIVGVSAVTVGVGAIVLIRRSVVPIRLSTKQVFTSGNAPVWLATERGAEDVGKVIKNTLDMLPKAHVEALHANGVGFYAVKNMGELEAVMRSAGRAGDLVQQSSAYGMFLPAINGIIIPKSIMMFGQQVTLDKGHLIKTILHETGHALDAKGAGIGHLSRNLDMLMKEYSSLVKNQGTAGIAMEEFYKRAYKTPVAIRQEIFADVYAAKFMRVNTNEPHFFGGAATADLLRREFPETMAQMGKVDLTKPSGFNLPRIRYGAESMAITAMRNNAEYKRIQQFLSDINRFR